MYVHRPPLVDSFSALWYVWFSVNEPSKWPSIKIDDPKRRGKNGKAMAMVGHAGETGYSRHSWSKLFETFLVTSVIRWVNSPWHTTVYSSMMILRCCVGERIMRLLWIYSPPLLYDKAQPYCTAIRGLQGWFRRPRSSWFRVWFRVWVGFDFQSKSAEIGTWFDNPTSIFDFAVISAFPLSERRFKNFLHSSPKKIWSHIETSHLSCHSRAHWGLRRRSGSILRQQQAGERDSITLGT